jgi:hypothetical protein
VSPTGRDDATIPRAARAPGRLLRGPWPPRARRTGTDGCCPLRAGRAWSYSPSWCRRWSSSGECLTAPRTRGRGRSSRRSRRSSSGASITVAPREAAAAAVAVPEMAPPTTTTSARITPPPADPSPPRPPRRPRPRGPDPSQPATQCRRSRARARNGWSSPKRHAQPRGELDGFDTGDRHAAIACGPPSNDAATASGLAAKRCLCGLGHYGRAVERGSVLSTYSYSSDSTGSFRPNQRYRT